MATTSSRRRPIPEAAAKATEETTDWGPPMLGALTVNLATFIGVFLLFPPVKKMSARPLFGAMLFAFAAGALLACPPSSCSSLKPLTSWQWDGVLRLMWFGAGGP